MIQNLFSKPSFFTYEADTLTVPYAPAPQSATPDVDSALGIGLLPADVRGDSSLLCTQSVGMEMQAIPYHPHVDNVFVATLLFSFFLLAFTLATEKSYLLQRIESMFYPREVSSLSSVEEMKSGFKCNILLSLFTCLLLALAFVDYTYEVMPQIFQSRPLPFWLGLYAVVILVAYAVKMALFAFADWIFFDKEQNSLWIDTYVLCYSIGGIFLFMLISSVVYFDLSNLCAFISIVVITLLIEILLLYKCFKVFFSKKYGCIYLIVYFCTLELVPCLLVWKTLVMANNLLIINY